MPAPDHAAERGKQSVSLIELKARFDEHRNIGWSRSLEQAGVHVVFGYPNLKIHAKMTLVVRREGGELRRYVHLGTGNYNILTARTYEDYGLFTADPEITADVADLFNLLTGFGTSAGVPQAPRRALRAPAKVSSSAFATCDAQQPRRQGSPHPNQGQQSQRRCELIEELYRASQEGAKIDIVARSICTLRPGVPGLSEGIRVRSILGRFLEHSRLFIFDAGEKRTILMEAPDLMPRNLDHRIELVAPIEDSRAQHELIRAFDVLLADNASAWELSPEGRWMKLRPKKGDRGRQAQQVFMRSVRARARRARATAAADQRCLRRLVRPSRVPTDTPVRIASVRVGIVDVGREHAPPAVASGER